MKGGRRLKIIIVGIGKVGYTIAEQLSVEKHDIVIIDKDDAALTEADTELDVIGISGNGATRRILLEAGVEDCDLLIALTGSDEVNLLCCLLARKLGAASTIARVRNPEYNDELGLLNDSLGLSMAVNPEREAAMEILRILRFPGADNIEVFAKGRIDLVSFCAKKHCSLCNKTIVDGFKNIKARALICAIKRQNEVSIPTGDSVILPGDTVVVLTLREDTADFFKEIRMQANSIKKTMIIGGGRIARYLASEMDSYGMGVTIIEQDEQVAQELSYTLPNATVICGDGTNRTLLFEEGLEDMNAMCCLTGFDEENILLSLYAKNVAPKIKTVTKVNKTAFREVIRTLDIGSVVYPQHLTASLILRHVRAMKKRSGGNLEVLYKVVDNKVEALEFTVGEDSELAGRTIENMKLRKNLLIGCICRDGRFFIPCGQDELQIGDSVIIVTTSAGLSALDDIVY